MIMYPNDVFHGSPMLQGLSPQERGALLALLRRRRYRRQEVVFHQGDAGDTLHLVRRGRLKVLIPAETGEEAVLTIVGPGDLFGELTLLDGGPRSATVVALEDVETVTLSRADFLDLLRREPAVVEALLATLARTIRRLSEDVTDLMSLDLRGRLAKKLLELAEAHGARSGDSIEIQVSLTQEELAGLIGATRPRVNKLLGFFEDRGAIARRGRRIIIVKPEALRCWVSQPGDW
jgi:CRP/FNR family transcriptional regulator, cyclic AMP receptor protein